MELKNLIASILVANGFSDSTEDDPEDHGATYSWDRLWYFIGKPHWQLKHDNTVKLIIGYKPDIIATKYFEGDISELKLSDLVNVINEFKAVVK